jgi:hypothetical protein
MNDTARINSLNALISVFVVFHLLLIICWLFPQFAWQRGVNSCFRKYTLFWGLDQDYRVFAPTPRAQNVDVLGVITYSDGTMKLFQFPQVQHCDPFHKLLEERYRKFVNDNLAWSEDAGLIRDLARYIAYHSGIAGKQPLMVSLIRYSAAIPPPEISAGRQLPPNWQRKTLINYAVGKEDFQ